MQSSKDQVRPPAEKDHSSYVGRTSDSGFTEAYRTCPRAAIPSEAVTAQNQPWLFAPTPFLHPDSVIAPGPAPLDVQKARPAKRGRCPARSCAAPSLLDLTGDAVAGNESGTDHCAEQPSSPIPAVACAIDGVVDPATSIPPAASTPSETPSEKSGQPA